MTQVTRPRDCHPGKKIAPLWAGWHEGMGESAAITNQPGPGTTVKLTLPLTRPSAL